MKLIEIVKNEFKEKPVGAIGLMVSIISLFFLLTGSPFLPGTVFNPVSPQLNITPGTLNNLEASQWKYSTYFWINNTGSVNTKIKYDIMLFNENQHPIKNYKHNFSSSNEPIESLNPSHSLEFDIFTNDFLSTYFICVKDEDDKVLLSEAYEIFALPSDLSHALNYLKASEQKFKKEREKCNLTL